MSNPLEGAADQETASLPTETNAGATSPLLHGSETSFTSCSNDAERPAPGTPSSTTSSLPPTKHPRLLLTPTAERLCERIYQRSRGVIETPCLGPWDPFPFSWTDWESLQAFLTAVRKQRYRSRFDDTVLGFYEDKLHLSYFSDTELAVFRMPISRKHEIFLQGVVDEIKSGLRKCITRARKKKHKNNAAYIQAAAYANLVQDLRSSLFRYTTEDGTGLSRQATHDPDGSFCFMPPSIKEPVPGLIIEVSYTQKRKDLPKLADHYLLGTDGPDVQLVLALDLNYYSNEKGASVICFRRQSEMCDGEEVVSVVREEHSFRDNNSRPLPGKLQLHLSDFGRPTLQNVPDPIQQTTIDFAKLNKLLDRADQRTDTQSEQETQRLSLEFEEARNAKGWGANVRKRHRESSSPEQVAEEDEQRIQHAESQAAKRARKEIDYTIQAEQYHHHHHPAQPAPEEQPPSNHDDRQDDGTMMT